MLYKVFLAVLFSLLKYASSFHSWSYLQKINIKDAESTYGESKAMISGRGFETLITGYATNPQPSLFVHTTDDGRDLYGTHTWSLQQILTPNPNVRSTDMFGQWVVSFNQTIITSSPYSDEGSVVQGGAVYIYNGTRRHWSQLQKLVGNLGNANGNYGHFGASIALKGNRLVVGAPGAQSELGYGFVFDRPYEGGLFSQTEILMPKEGYSYTYQQVFTVGSAEIDNVKIGGSMFAQTVTQYDNYASFSCSHPFPPTLVPIVGTINLIPSYNRTGSVYVFQKFVSLHLFV